MELYKKDISKILDTNNIRYIIPTNQRQYEWDQIQIDKFVDDILSKNNHIFNGITIEKIEKTLFTITDGQQRLITLSIFYKVIMDLIKRKNIISNIDDATRIYYELENRIIYNNKPRIEYKIQTTEHIYEKLIMETNDNDNEDIFNMAYEYINLKLKNKSTLELIQIINKLNNSDEKIIGVSEFSKDDSFNQQTLFNDINTGGKELSKGSIIKNLIYEVSDNLSDVSDDKIIEWYNLFNHNNDWENFSKRKNNHSKLTKFLALYIGYKTDKYVSPNDITKEYENYIKINGSSELFKDELIKMAKIYGAIVGIHNISLLNLSSIEKDYLESIDKIGSFNHNIVQIITLLFFKYRDQNDDRINSMKLLDSVVINNFLSNNTGRDEIGAIFYTQMFGDYYKMIKNDNLIFYYIQTHIIHNADKFKKSYNYIEETMIHHDHTQRKKIKYILYRLNKYKIHSFSDVELSTFDNYTLEHILPQKYTKWYNDLFPNREPNNEDIIYVDKYKETIGNFILITQQLNSSIKNSTYIEKKKKYDKFINLPLSQELTENETWDVDIIKENSKKLYNMVIDAFQSPYEMIFQKK